MQPIQPPTEASCDQHDGDARSAELVGARLHHRAADGPQWLAFAVILRRDHIGVMQSYASIPENAGIAAGRLSLRVTPHGHLVCEPAGTTLEMDKVVAARVSEAFGQGSGYGLLRLGAGEVGQALPPVFIWWRGFATRYVAALCQRGTGMTTGGSATEAIPDVAAPSEAELAELVVTAPMMAGAEYLSPGRSARIVGRDGASRRGIARGCRHGFAEFSRKRRTRPGISSAACISTWPRTATMTSTVRFPCDLHDAPLGPWQGAAPAAVQALREYAGAANRRSCCRCCCRCSAPRETALGCEPWWMPARSTIRCAGRRWRPSAF